MKTLKSPTILLLGFLSVFTATRIYSQAPSKRINFEKEYLHIEKSFGYDQITYGDLELSRQVGAPQLPVKTVRYTIPPGKEIKKVIIKNTKSEMLEGTYHLFPAQPPQILSDSEYEFVPPDKKIYASSNPFPKKIVKAASSGYLFSHNIATLLIYPVQYIPSKKNVLFVSELEIEIEYTDNGSRPRYYRSTPTANRIRNKLLDGLVENRQDHVLQLRKETEPRIAHSEEEHLYVIVTSTPLISGFRPLADWKFKKGLSSKIVSIPTILENYSGTDLQEKIRNLIIHAYQHWGTMWVLLGGDTNIIPARKAFAFDCEYGDYWDNFIPCDLYYSDLDGDWNANGNDIYGEVEDEIDMYPDVFVGRAPVENVQETEAFVDKIITYERSAPMGHERNMLFLADVLWHRPYTNSGKSKDLIDRLYVPDRFDPIIKLYADLGNESRASVKNALNEGYNIVNHNGHAWYSLMGVGDGSLRIADMDALANGPRYSILFSIGCWPAAIDYDCIAEHFVTNPNGGGVAFIGNSRYGWGSPGNPEYGYSDRFDQQFYKHLFVDSIVHVGSAFGAAKSAYVPYSQQENVYRWCEYELNLLGDPEMPIWTDTPRQLTVQYPNELPVGESFCSIVVTDGIQPVQGALVCLMQDEGVYETGITGMNGTVDFSINTPNLSNELQLTVTAHNYIPFEESISLFSDAAHLQVVSFSTNKSAKGYVSPEENVNMDCCFKNDGGMTATDVSASLEVNSTGVILIDSTASVGDILPGDSVTVDHAFSFRTDADLVNGEVIQLRIRISDSENHIWIRSIPITVATPLLAYQYYQVSDTLSGDGDGFAEAGETAELAIAVRNTGLDTAGNVSVALKSPGSDISFPTPSVDMGTISPADTGFVSFETVVGHACPSNSFYAVALTMTTEDNKCFADSFSVSIGEFGFRDNMENGGVAWTHSGSPDLWHLTLNRKHSGNVSWYCGDQNELTYKNNMENSIETEFFTIDQNSELSFWCWYEYPNYGVNGIYPEINDGTGWQKLDFIGSGGALETLPTRNTWLKYLYDLSNYPPGTSLKLRFRFVSDYEKVTEGVYIDDVIVQNKHHDFHFRAPPIPDAPQLVCSDVKNKIKLSWELNSEDIENFNRNGYSFQGYNVYQLDSSKAVPANGVCIATFDIKDGVTEIVEDIIDPETGDPVQITQQYGSDTGLQRSMLIDEDYIEEYHLVKGKPYYFAVTAYTYNPDPQASPKTSESKLDVTKIVFQEDSIGHAFGDTISVTQISGESGGSVFPVVVDPSQLTGHDYRVGFERLYDGTLVWNLTDMTTNTQLLHHQTNFGEDSSYPVLDGFQLGVKDAALKDFSDLTVDGDGSYYITSFYQHGWAKTARAADVFGEGTDDLIELEKDYELRFTGEYDDPTADVVSIKEGTGSIAVIYGARYYQLADHPMNPSPGSNDPFGVRIPFEVWNVDDHRQVNLLIYDRKQQLSDFPFYTFNPKDRMYGYILNTAYQEDVADQYTDQINHLTWNMIFWSTDFSTGDIVTIQYENTIKPSDVFVFSTDIDTSVEGAPVPQTFTLNQNFPNPFRETTTIGFYLQRTAFIELKIYNLLGEEITTLTKSKWAKGKHTIIWETKNLPSGVYLYRLKSEDFAAAKKLILLR